MPFNAHSNVTSDGHVIVQNMLVWTNEADVGKVIADSYAGRCCSHGEPAPCTKTQFKVNGAWFSDHASARKLDYPHTVCCHDHWFDVEYADGRKTSMNGERLAVFGFGKAAKDVWSK